MTRRTMVALAACLTVAAVVVSQSHRGPATAAAPAPTAEARSATIDLATLDGVAAVNGEWRYSDTRIVEVSFPGPGSEGQPTGPSGRTYDYEPKAGAAEFDDSRWEVIDPASLVTRRSTGRLCFNWYRIAVTIPDRVGIYDATGSTVTFETALDDYAEIWVDGELPRALGQSGGSVVAGWNAQNEVVLTRNARPGQTIQIAVFGINGPISNPPTNFIWMRYARLRFTPGAPGPMAVDPQEVNIEVTRNSAGIDAVVGPNPKLFKLAEGFTFTEGPVWVPSRQSLLFSDPNENRIFEYTSDGRLSVFRAPSGYSGADIADYKQPGSNGLAIDAQGRLTVNEHGNRRVTRLDGDRVTVLADRFHGKRLNSPNDLVYRSDGALFFTDPPFGLPRAFDDPRKELEGNGIYMLRDGTLTLISDELRGPNGIAFSPDERYLYVGNWDESHKVVMRYRVGADGRVTESRVFADMTSAPGEDAIDGIKVDGGGNVFVSGPGGIWVWSAAGEHLGTIVTPRHAHNMAWGDDGKSLYLTARDRLYRIRLLTGNSLVDPS